MPRYITATPILSALLCVLSALPLLAEPDGSAAPSAPKRVALLVGVNKYLKPGFKDLEFAEADVTAVGDELRRLGFAVTVLLGSGVGEQQATLANIETAARKMVTNLGKYDLALVMLSGHGQQLSREPGDISFQKSESFYCPVDAQVNRSETQVSLSFLLDEILAPNVGRKVLLVDACRDVPIDATRGSRNTKGIEGRVIALPEDTAVFFSCRAGQMSFERHELGHGLFTWCVLEGLRGKAVMDGELSWSSLVAHVDRRMQQPDVTKHMPASLRQVPIPAGALPYTVLARITSPPQITDDLPISSGSNSSAAVSSSPTPPPNPVPPRDPDLLIAPFTAAQAVAGRSLWAKRVDQPETVTNSVDMILNLIPPGEFTMGDAKHYDTPSHTVRLTRPFYLGRHEVTQRQWAAVMGNNPSHFSHAGVGGKEIKGLNTSDCPVESVSWYDCIEYCNRLSERDGKTPYYTLSGVERQNGRIATAQVSVTGGRGYRLPTEAEWEYACRAGTETDYHWGSTMEAHRANVSPGGGVSHKTPTQKPGLNRTTSVGRYLPNSFGLYDMHGNAQEWCHDWYRESYYKDSPTVDPAGPVVGESRVCRGGDYYANYGQAWSEVTTYYPTDSRSSVRQNFFPRYGRSQTGLRVALDVPESPSADSVSSPDDTESRPFNPRFPFGLAGGHACHTWDAEGRLWVAAPAEGTPQMILIFEDTDGDGRGDKRTVFAERTDPVLALRVDVDGVRVTSRLGTALLKDRNGDGKAD